MRANARGGAKCVVTPGSQMPDPRNSLPPEVIEALRAGKPIEAMKLLRKSSGVDLKAAKDAIEAQLRNASSSRMTARSPHAPEAKRALEALHRKFEDPRHRRLSPGEVPRTTVESEWLVALAAAVLAIYYFLR